MCICCCPSPAPVATLQRCLAHCVLAIMRSRACVQDMREHLISSSHGRRRGAQHHATPSSSANQQQQRMASLLREAIGGQQWKDQPSAAAGAPVSASSASRLDCCGVMLSGCHLDHSQLHHRALLTSQRPAVLSLPAAQVPACLTATGARCHGDRSCMPVCLLRQTI